MDSSPREFHLAQEAFDQLKSALSDRYTIERELGRGGNAVVHLARDLKHDRLVALKVLTPELALAVRTERFFREIQIAAKLTHPHILPLFDSGVGHPDLERSEREGSAILYYAMPYVEGESLRDRLKREKQLPVDDALRITREVAGALDYAHQHDVVHRDIKPENILLSHGEAMVMDFGIARALTVAGGDTVTESGIAVGTPAYMSPEQGAGTGEPDARSDIYSLGCVLYEMLAGHPPFTGASAQEVLARHALDPLPSLKAARPDVSDALERTVANALAKVPAARFATAAHFARALTAPTVAADSPQRTLVYAGLGLVLLLGGSAIAWSMLRPPSGSPAGRSIAVLPFANLSTDPENEYFSDGMTDDLINLLTQVEGLRVSGRTSSFSFKGKNVQVAEVGRRLNVATVLEGSVRRAGVQLRVTAQLVNASDGNNLWSQQYDRPLKDASDVFAIQDEISQAIVSALRVNLKGSLPSRPVNLEAYQLYLQGRFFWNKNSGEEGFNRAREFFTAAIEKDSGYARAWAGLADTYEQLLVSRYLPRAEAYPKALAAAERGVALDSQLAEGYASRGRIRHRQEWDWSGAGVDYRRAVALDPSYALGHLWYARFLVEQGSFTEAIREAGRAAELDPLSALVLKEYSGVLFNARQYGPALEQARKALQLEPNAEGHQRLAVVYVFQGKFADAIQEFQAALALLGGRGRVSTNLARMGFAYARAGRRDEALRVLEDMKRRAASGDNALIGHEINLAILYAGLGEKDQAFVWLERARQGHDYNLTSLGVSPFFDPLRSDPRFEELLKKVGLEP